MPEIPEGATVPQDHLPSHQQIDGEHAAAIAEDELLADMPSLVPPTQLRLRQRNKVMKLAISLRSFAGGSEGDEESEIDLESLSDDDLGKFLDVLADIDDFAESIADDPAAYVAWSKGKDYDVFSALLGRYSSAVGKSTGSSS